MKEQRQWQEEEAQGAAAASAAQAAIATFGTEDLDTPPEDDHHPAGVWPC